MVNLFRFLKNEDVRLEYKGQRVLLNAITAFLENYDYCEDMESVLPWLKEDYSIYHKNFIHVYGILSPRLAHEFLKVDLDNLEKRLEMKGAQESDVELTRIIGNYLAQGELSRTAWVWLSKNLSPRQDCGDYEGLTDF